MKFLIAIAMLALVGVSSTSTHLTNEMTDLMKVYKRVLGSLIRDAAKQITENAAFDENIDFESFDQEVAVGEFSHVEDNHISEDVEIWKNCTRIPEKERIECCKTVRIIKKYTICVGMEVVPEDLIRMDLKYKGKIVWARIVEVKDTMFKFCTGSWLSKICFKLYDLHVADKHVKGCLLISSKAGIPIRKKIGCFDQEITTTMKGSDSFNVHKEYIFNRPPRRYVHGNNVLRFQA